MKKLSNGVLYDTLRSEKILTATGHLGERSLWIGKQGHFFTIEENGSILVPCSPGEAMEFLEVYRNGMDPQTYRNIIVKHFGKEPPAPVVLPHGAVLVARDADPFADELYFSNGKFWLKPDEGDLREIFASEALKFIESIQDDFSPDQLEKILKRFFPNIKRG